MALAYLNTAQRQYLHVYLAVLKAIESLSKSKLDHITPRGQSIYEDTDRGKEKLEKGEKCTHRNLTT